MVGIIPRVPNPPPACAAAPCSASTRACPSTFCRCWRICRTASLVRRGGERVSVAAWPLPCCSPKGGYKVAGPACCGACAVLLGLLPSQPTLPRPAPLPPPPHPAEAGDRERSNEIATGNPLVDLLVAVQRGVVLAAGKMGEVGPLLDCVRPLA